MYRLRNAGLNTSFFFLCLHTCIIVIVLGFGKSLELFFFFIGKCWSRHFNLIIIILSSNHIAVYSGGGGENCKRKKERHLSEAHPGKLKQPSSKSSLSLPSLALSEQQRKANISVSLSLSRPLAMLLSKTTYMQGTGTLARIPKRPYFFLGFQNVAAPW